MDIRIDGVTKHFDRYPALHGVDLDIRSGELLALLGPSGSGKTTLLRLIAGLEQPDSGRIFFGDEDASRRPVQDRRVGFVFQSYALFRNMTVLDNVAFGLGIRPRASRPARPEIRRRALELLDLVQLKGLEKRFPQQLSGGQRQRVALARALAIEPRVLLLDEPFGALDAQVRRDLRKWLRELHDRTGHTTVFVTHDQNEALELADRVAVMSQGRLEQVGTPDEVYDEAANAFVFEFIGEANWLPAVVAGGRISIAGQPSGISSAGLTPGPARFFFRPGETASASAASCGLSGTVVQSRRIAGVRRAELQVDGVDHIVEIDLPLDRRVAAGDHIPFHLLAGRVFSEPEAGDGHVRSGDRLAEPGPAGERPE
jgi:sulfate transport system ATP-binding protein